MLWYVGAARARIDARRRPYDAYHSPGNTWTGVLSRESEREVVMALATMALVSMLMGSTSGVGTPGACAAPCTELTAPVVPTAHYAVRRSKGVIRMRGCRPSVDDVRRPGFNGRAWTGNPIVGNSLPAPCGNAAAYGADPSEEQVIYFPAWPHMIAIDPFEPVRTDKAGIDAVYFTSFVVQ